MQKIENGRSRFDTCNAVGGILRGLTIVGLPFLLTACFQPGTIHNLLGLEDDKSVLIGARQRAILNIPVDEGSRARTCQPEARRLR